MFLAKFLGWEQASADEYRYCYQQYGGNFSTHPNVLEYFHRHIDCQERYYVHQRAGQLNGAVCVWQHRYLANDTLSGKLTEHLALPVAKDELILPINREKRLFVPWKSKIVSPINHNIINRSERLNARRSIMLARPLTSFSKKTIRTYNQRLNRFLSEGGEIRDQAEFSAEKLVDIYDMLFEKRRNRRIDNKVQNLDFIQQFRDHLFGKVLFFKGEPCAFQLITKNLSGDIVALDYINIGLDLALEKLSIGSVSMWVNLQHAYASFADIGQLRFSFGRPTADYKQRWCYQQKLGRLL
ncbi:GNAT family N-acetyltransferase [Serratia microhaemolytica]|uniref:GNAT family N-acetyltransferase n=1 Tax=Serratia microhaemolytica TaxID=2675110 RepID=UPI000FDD8A85|nr:GNAT family N-acetyltransferase [Serratia microhaemolytica]